MSAFVVSVANVILVTYAWSTMPGFAGQLTVALTVGFAFNALLRIAAAVER